MFSNYHVFEGTNIGRETIETSDGTQYRIAEVLSQSSENDFIIFKVSSSRSFNYLPIPAYLPEVGEDVFAIGNPRGLEHTLSTGIVSGYRENNQLIQTTTEITHGSSGGPLLNMNGEVIGRRKSPKKMGFHHIFEELVSIPTFIMRTNFELEIILIREEEIRVNNGKGSWRKKGWSSIDRRLVDIVDRKLFSTPKDFLHLIPDTLEEPFTTKALAETLKIPRRLVQKMTYCMRKMEMLKMAGKAEKRF